MSYKRFIIVGCGRSATKYASMLFTQLGLKCSHQGVHSEQCDERIGSGNRRRGPVWDDYVGSSSAFAAPLLDEVDDETLIIHQVRNPWRVARSLVAATHVPGQRDTKGVKFYARHATGLNNYTFFELKAAQLWWQWNLLIEKHAKGKPNYLFHRVEDYNLEWVAHVLELLGQKMNNTQVEVFKKLSTNEGSVNPKGAFPDLREMHYAFWEMVANYKYVKP